ncbi:REP-associated tyrosine transposase [Kangiella marina]|uniref:Transposase n=1 Tax=Kangiella marina TaxID=1079178 RepID=A0ABP8IDM8_9GAMM
MADYRRIYVPNGTYFFTVNLQDRSSNLLISEIAKLRAAFAKVKLKHDFHIDAVTILPDHLHCVVTFGQATNYSDVIRLIKSYFSKSLPKGEHRTASRVSKSERGIWQRRYWTHLITSEDDYNRHIEYCYINPVKHGYVERVRDWPYSSFHRDVKRGLFTSDWGGTKGGFEKMLEFGER